MIVRIEGQHAGAWLCRMLFAFACTSIAAGLLIAQEPPRLPDTQSDGVSIGLSTDQALSMLKSGKLKVATPSWAQDPETVDFDSLEPELQAYLIDENGNNLLQNYTIEEQWKIITYYRQLIAEGNIWDDTSLYGDTNMSKTRFTMEGTSAFARNVRGDSGAQVLNKAVQIMDSERLIIGSCWDWVNTIFKDLGFIGAKLTRVFQGKAGSGPFANPADIRPGDWLMYDNLSYGAVGHSGIFVMWLDFERQSALILSYPGGKRQEPGRYKEYDISRTWYIGRGK